MADDVDNLVSLDAARTSREVAEVPELELTINVTMSQNGCEVEWFPSARTVIDTEDPETIRRVCVALNTTIHVFMKKFRLKTLKAQRQRLKRTEPAK
jgi:hypothetical protein